jgi:uncharacterized protein (DUF924 family)
MESQESILAFWFGDEPDDATVAAGRAPLWWSGDPGTDAEIRRRFEPLVEAAGAGELDEWRSSIRGRLALVLLTDQFPRSIYRGTPAAFACDAIARSLCLESLADGSDCELRPIERVFLYLPFEHSESLADQDRAVELFRTLAAEVAPGIRPTFEEYLDYALRHRTIIERFGRFPHRNAILARPSTPAEIAFLEEPGSSF